MAVLKVEPTWDYLNTISLNWEFTAMVMPNMELINMTYSKKIRVLRESLKLNQIEFSKKTSIPLSTLRKVETGHSNVGLTIIEKIIKVPELERYTHWLMSNDIPSESGLNSGIESNQVSPEANKLTAKEPNHIELPFYEVTASAGGGALVEAENQTKSISFEPAWLRKEIGVNPNDVFLMLVDGDSMYPTLKSESMIMVDRHLNSMSDGIYVLRHENSLLVKRLQMLPGGIIKVKSDNNMYEPWEINKSQLDGIDLELIGRVVWTGQRM